MPALGDDDPIARRRATSSSCARRSIANVERSRALIPIRRAERDRALELVRRRAPRRECPCRAPRAAAISVARRRVVEVAKEQQRRVGARLARRAQVVLGREEALREQRQRRRRARRSQVVQVAAEALVDEHGDRRRAGALERAASAAGSASGRRSPADGERRLTSAIAAEPGAASASAKPSRLDRLRRENATSSSSRSRARRRSRSPPRRGATPFSRSSACPAAAIAPAAFSSTASRLRAGRAREHLRTRARVLVRRAAREARSGEQRSMPRSRGSIVALGISRPRPRTRGSVPRARARRSRRRRARRTRVARRARRAPRATVRTSSCEYTPKIPSARRPGSSAGRAR